MKSFKIWDHRINGNKSIVSLPTERIVCPDCGGNGRTSNPAIDGNGLSDECLGDVDFMDGYMAGNYDIRCGRCNGSNVIDEAIEDWDNPDFVAYTKHLEDEESYADEIAAERAMGA